jgi:hypothetical protein
MKIYISGQITGLKEAEYTRNFTIASFDLIKKINFSTLDKTINPLNLKPFLGVKCWLCYMITDLYYLKKCTHIAMQKNWINSKGAIIEYFVAKFIYKLEIIWL